MSADDADVATDAEEDDLGDDAGNAVGTEPDGAVPPTSLRYVGPATAAAFDGAPFDAADLRHRTVSFSELLAAGVNPGVAAKLRREYSLVWAFRWRAGADLARRAELVGGLDDDHREWIAASAPVDGEPLSNGETVGAEAERAWRERSAWLGAAAGPPACDRCGDALETFQLGDRESVQCPGCGYVGVIAQR